MKNKGRFVPFFSRIRSKILFSCTIFSPTSFCIIVSNVKSLYKYFNIRYLVDDVPPRVSPTSRLVSIAVSSSFGFQVWVFLLLYHLVSRSDDVVKHLYVQWYQNISCVIESFVLFYYRWFDFIKIWIWLEFFSVHATHAPFHFWTMRVIDSFVQCQLSIDSIYGLF